MLIGLDEIGADAQQFGPAFRIGDLAAQIGVEQFGRCERLGVVDAEALALVALNLPADADHMSGGGQGGFDLADFEEELLALEQLDSHPHDRVFEKTVSNMQEVMARHGKVVMITDRAGADRAGEGLWRTVRMPVGDNAFAPILYALPVQMLAYHAAVAKGTDVDQPRNLAKSVTVE